jgi:Tol biopolymer transport system component
VSVSRVCALTLAAVVAAGFAVLDGRAAHMASRAAPRILYASDWSGTSQIYAVDPAGRAAPGQLTFGRAPACEPGRPCGYVAPEQSPDGSKVLLWDHVDGGYWYARLFVARADGSSRRRILTVNHFTSAPASWSPDSRRIAYGDGDGVRVINASGGRSRLLASTARSVLFGDVSWSPAGNWIAYVADGLRLVSADGRRSRDVAKTRGGFTWSPDGRSLAFAGDGIQIYDVRTGAVRRLATHSAAKLAWSPDGRLIAFWSEGRNGLVVVKSGVVRLLNSDVLTDSSSLTWSPDSQLLAYTRSDRRPLGLASTDLRVVDRRGYVRTVVSRGAPYGGAISGVSWTRSAAGVRYRRPAGRTLAVASQHELVAPFRIERLAADDARVAYAACGHVFVWTPSAGRVEQAEDQTSLSPRCYDNRGIVSLAIAGDRVATGWIGGGNTTFWWLGGAVLDPSRTGFELGTGFATMGTPRARFLDNLVGDGSLLVFSSRDEGWVGGACCDLVTTRERIVEANPPGCPCATLATEPGPFVPDDVDDSRIVAIGDNAVVILDWTGKRLLAVDVKASAAQLSGRDLVILAGGRLMHFDASTGSELHAWPIAGSPTLQDAARGLAAYVVDGQVHVLRLADGRDVVVAAGTLARFLDDGLVNADGARLHLVPFERLPHAP